MQRPSLLMLNKVSIVKHSDARKCEIYDWINNLIYALYGTGKSKALYFGKCFIWDSFIFSDLVFKKYQFNKLLSQKILMEHFHPALVNIGIGRAISSSLLTYAIMSIPVLQTLLLGCLGSRV